MAAYFDPGVLADHFAAHYDSAAFGHSLIIHTDCLVCMETAPAASIHAIVTDSPYGVKEY